MEPKKLTVWGKHLEIGEGKSWQIFPNVLPLNMRDQDVLDWAKDYLQGTTHVRIARDYDLKEQG